jgi:hypothetical protein
MQLSKRGYILGLVLVILVLAGCAGSSRAQDTDVLEAEEGVASDIKIQTVNGVAPLHWTIQSGSLPFGLKLSTDGQISGTPAQAQVSLYEFTLQVSDSSQPPQMLSHAYRLVVKARPLKLVETKPLRILSPGESGATEQVASSASAAGPTSASGATDTAPPPPPGDRPAGD